MKDSLEGAGNVNICRNAVDLRKKVGSAIMDAELSMRNVQRIKRTR